MNEDSCADLKDAILSANPNIAVRRTIASRTDPEARQAILGQLARSSRSVSVNRTMFRVCLNKIIYD